MALEFLAQALVCMRGKGRGILHKEDEAQCGFDPPKWKCQVSTWMDGTQKEVYNMPWVLLMLVLSASLNYTISSQSGEFCQFCSGLHERCMADRKSVV